ncbi:hypothetical protein [Parachryseolinea silvisoli]|uniref:hypothetical protein n=1 Tax=Parachryseolinea silvisoli TaxID=2873601 RepID=UPI002265A35D|nr:hypothetical protein [Parachryseolinea silvisoli]MCD9015502.1 hypothetical protein [Parachryseolinea silvisoli]
MKDHFVKARAVKRDGTCSEWIEIGFAFTVCQEFPLRAKDTRPKTVFGLILENARIEIELKRQGAFDLLQHSWLQRAILQFDSDLLCGADIVQTQATAENNGFYHDFATAGLAKSNLSFALHSSTYLTVISLAGLLRHRCMYWAVSLIGRCNSSPCPMLPQQALWGITI